MLQGHAPSKVSKEGSAFVSSSFQQLPAVPYIALLVEARLQSLPCLHIAVSLCVCTQISQVLLELDLTQ